jgi:hypothetical protein
MGIDTHKNGTFMPIMEHSMLNNPHSKVALALSLASLLETVSATVAEPSQILTMDGIGNVRIRMTQQEVKKAIGAKLNISSAASGNA